MLFALGVRPIEFRHRMDVDQSIQALCISSEATLLLAIKQMDDVRKKLLIVTKSDKYFSLLSIGDIQRAVIRNESLESPISGVLRDKVTVCHTSDSMETIRAEMMRFRTDYMPIVDDSNNLVRVHFWAAQFGQQQRVVGEPLNVPVVIMAGCPGHRP